MPRFSYEECSDGSTIRERLYDVRSVPGYAGFSVSRAEFFGQQKHQRNRMSDYRTITLSEGSLDRLSRGVHCAEAKRAASEALEPACLSWFRGQSRQTQGVLSALGAAHVRAAFLPGLQADIRGAAITRWNSIAGDYIAQCE